MKYSQILLTVLLSAAVAFGVGKYAAAPNAQGEAKKETAFERVMRTQTIRCGYIVTPPFLAIEPKTGQKSGIAFDYVSALGKELGMKIEWAEETTWGTFSEGLRTGRYDVMCMPLWESGPRAKAALFSRPLYDCDLSLFSRADDRRFDSGLKSANAKDVIVATVEGDISIPIRQNKLPLTKELVLPAGTDDGQYYMNVLTRKADVGFAFQYAMEAANATSGNKFRLIGKNEPVQSYGTGLTVAHGEVDLKLMLDSTIATLLKSGEAASIIAKYKGVSLPSVPAPMKEKP